MIYDIKLPAYKWPFYVMRHPFEGFSDMRWKKAGSMGVAMVIVALFFIAGVFQERLTGFIFHGYYTKIFNVVPLLTQSVIIFFVWVLGNWSLCTLFNGEGTMRNICITSAYALVPYIMASFINVGLSQILTREEGAFLQYIYYIGLVWSVVLMISGLKAVHQYSIPKTIISMFFTVFAMIVIMFLLVLLLSLFQQVYVFVYSIYTELMYRYSV